MPAVIDPRRWHPAIRWMLSVLTGLAMFVAAPFASLWAVRLLGYRVTTLDFKGEFLLVIEVPPGLAITAASGVVVLALWLAFDNWLEGRE